MDFLEKTIVWKCLCLEDKNSKDEINSKKKKNSSYILYLEYIHDKVNFKNIPNSVYKISTFNILETIENQET